ncbi:MAG: putative E3 ubiquitin ligase triad3 [Dasosvirus sp.]|uniref:Putative E3 ubiquitin ligase triad3 n=1 Tax=Dasosvirus sp. TaxID=2487764 RepID=A0A3G4ZV30_9VIRU|nr:MAG: putative E3 ubiquitin ligase triad3 [Dasosvirus sp.]
MALFRENNHSLIISNKFVVLENNWSVELPKIEKKKKKKVKNKTFLCTCCFDKVSKKRKMSCTSGHLICQNCLEQYITIKISDADIKIKCAIDSKCDGTYNHNHLEKMLKYQLYYNLCFLKIKASLSDSEIDDLYVCPKCSHYYVLMDQEHIDALSDPKLQCLNKNCRYASCLKCKLAFHGKVSCDYGSKDKKIRKNIEEILTDEKLTRCPRCRKKCDLYSGCNKFSCTCGTKFCYLCGINVDGYDHFRSLVNLFGCPLYTKKDQMENHRFRRAVNKIHDTYQNDDDQVYEAYTILYELNRDRIQEINEKFIGITEKKDEKKDEEKNINLIEKYSSCGIQ